MRKVKTALDTSIRTKGVRSFSGRSGWSGRSNRGNPGTKMTGLSAISVRRNNYTAAYQYRRDAITRLSSSQRLAFETLPAQTQEQLLAQAEKKIDRRISAGRYRDNKAPAGVVTARSGIRKSRESPYDPFYLKNADIPERPGIQEQPVMRQAAMVQTEKRFDNRNRKGSGIQAENGYDVDEGEETLVKTGRQEILSDYGNTDGIVPSAYRRRRKNRDRLHKEQEKRLKLKKEAARRETGKSAYRNRVSSGQSGMDSGGTAGHGAGLRSADSSGSGSRSGTGAGGRLGIKISHDYAKVLGRLVETQVRFTKQLESSRSVYRKQQTIREMEEKEARRAYRIVSFSVSKAKAVLGDAIKAVKFLASKGKFYLLLLLPLILMVMMVPLLLSSISLTQEEATANAMATELVEYALQWVGVTRYIWGEGRAYETDWQDYTDCSGYVHGVFSHFGYEIGGDTVSMEGSGTLVQENGTDKALPGDIILFFSGGIAAGNSTHVGIYIGGGQMVHCSGGRANISPETAGPGVMVTMVAADSRPYQVRRIIPESASGGIGTGGHRVDPTNYSQADMELIWAIVAQEDNGSYEGALAVISSAMNRADSPVWGYLGSTAMQQLCAPGQYCYSNDHYWEARLGGNVPEYVKQAVNDCLKKGIRNHNFTCFRSTKGAQTGPDAVQIGGNWFFGN